MCYHDSVSLRNDELISHVFEAQRKLKIPKELCIDYSNEVEKANVIELLNLHKADVIKSYFHGFLAKSKNICSLSSLEYYFYSLFEYLEKHSKSHSLLSDKIYKFKDVEGSYSYYDLTEFGRAFYKLYYLSTLFIEKNERVRKLFEYINPDMKNWFMNYLKNNEISFCSYR